MPSYRKPVVWVSPTRKDIQAMPSLIRRECGGASIVEIVESFDSDAYPAVYAVRFEER